MDQKNISYDDVITMLEEYCQDKPEAGALHEKLVVLRNLVSKSEKLTDPVAQNETADLIEQKIEEIEYLLDELEDGEEYEFDDEDDEDFDDEDFDDEDYDDEDEDEDDFEDDEDDEDFDDEDEDYDYEDA